MAKKASKNGTRLSALEQATEKGRFGEKPGGDDHSQYTLTRRQTAAVKAAVKSKAKAAAKPEA